MITIHPDSTPKLSNLCPNYVTKACAWIESAATELSKYTDEIQQFIIEDETLGIYAIKRTNTPLKFGNTPMTGNFGRIKIHLQRCHHCQLKMASTRPLAINDMVKTCSEAKNIVSNYKFRVDEYIVEI